MAVVQLYKDKVYHYSQEGGYEDENGDWHEGTGCWVEPPTECEAVPNGQARSVKLDDGTTRIYSYTIYTKPSATPFKEGDRILVEKYRGEKKEYTVLGFHAYQLQCKIWV